MRNNPIYSPNTYDRSIEATAPQPCATCMRDIWHHKTTGRYPRGSKLVELSLFDERLREDTVMGTITLECGLEGLAEIEENRYLTVEQNRIGKWAARRIQIQLDRIGHLNSKLRCIAEELDLDRETYRDRE